MHFHEWIQNFKGLASNPASCFCPSKQNFVATCGHSEIQVQHLCKAAPSVESDVINAMLPCTAEDGGHSDSNLASSLTWPQTDAETHEITDFHNASIEQCRFFLHSLNFLEFHFFSSTLSYPTIANPGSRYLLLQTLQSLPALVTTFSTMECFLLLRCFCRLRTSTSMFWQNLLHFSAQKAQKQTIVSPLRLFNVSNPTGQLGVLKEDCQR